MNVRPAAELAKAHGTHYPNESEAYRRARTALLAEEIDLRRRIERVAEMRRALPPGGAVQKDYSFHGESGQVSFRQLFGDKQTLAIYSYMFGPQRKELCPMCTSLMGAWENVVPGIEQRIAFVCIARSPFERLAAAKEARGWHKLAVYSDSSGDFTRDYVSAEDADIPAYNVFTRRDGTIRHFWSSEMGAGTADPGQDPRGPQISIRFGLFLTPRRKGAEATGIRS